MIISTVRFATLRHNGRRNNNNGNSVIIEASTMIVTMMLVLISGCVVVIPFTLAHSVIISGSKVISSSAKDQTGYAPSLVTLLPTALLEQPSDDGSNDHQPPPTTTTLRPREEWEPEYVWITGEWARKLFEPEPIRGTEEVSANYHKRVPFTNYPTSPPRELMEFNPHLNKIITNATIVAEVLKIIEECANDTNKNSVAPLARPTVVVTTTINNGNNGNNNKAQLYEPKLLRNNRTVVSTNTNKTNIRQTPSLIHLTARDTAARNGSATSKRSTFSVEALVIDSSSGLINHHQENHQHAQASNSSSGASGDHHQVATSDTWPEMLKTELSYYRHLGADPLKSQLRPRWANPCVNNEFEQHVGGDGGSATNRRLFNLTAIRQNKITVSMNLANQRNRKQRSIAGAKYSQQQHHHHHFKPYKQGRLIKKIKSAAASSNNYLINDGGHSMINDDGMTMMMMATAMSKKSTNGHAKKLKFKYLHGSGVSAAPNIALITSNQNNHHSVEKIDQLETKNLHQQGQESKSANNTQELINTGTKLKDMLRSMFTRIHKTKDASNLVVNQLLSEYFPNRNQILNRTRSYRSAWLPEVNTLNASSPIYNNTREKIDVVVKYLQYFAVGFEQTLTDKIQFKDKHLLEVFHIEASVIDMLCLIEEVVNLNRIHSINYYSLYINKTNQQQQHHSHINNDTLVAVSKRGARYAIGKLLDLSDDHKRPAYVDRTVMNESHRLEKRRIYRYLRDYVLVRDYITFLSFLGSTMAEFTNNFLAIEKTQQQEQH